MAKQLCIHGHFYQPPREDPWLDEVLPEASAGPMRHWNQRIAMESYAPLAWARRKDGEGRVFEILNCYEWMSFNFGPTLIRWLERFDPETHARILEGDRRSAERWGHGNAVAQVYHHAIMPLAGELDKELEVAWAVDDFERRFGRKPEGMWLAEAAVDTPSLEVLADYGVRFVILAPRQAKAMADEAGRWREVAEHEVPIGEAHEVELPSGRSVAAFFYHGPISQAVAFEKLLEDGGQFWRRIADGAFDGLLSLGTDGETYGHHFAFGEMALAYVLDQGRNGADGLTLTNYAAFLAANPPARKVRLHEPSSWSCVHGVERWQSDCGCTTGGLPGWNQAWRAPLRRTIDGVKAKVDEHYFKAGAELFADPRAALVAYGKVLAGSLDPDAYAKRHFAKKLSKDKRAKAWKLLLMQQWALSSLASCAWFFDEVSRIEPINGLTYALRAAELAAETGGPKNLEGFITKTMAEARSNYPEKGTGADIFVSEVLPRRESPQTLVGQALFTLWAENRLPLVDETAEAAWEGVTVRVTVGKPVDRATAAGRAEIVWGAAVSGEVYDWCWERSPRLDPLAGRVNVLEKGEKPDKAGKKGLFTRDMLPWNKAKALALRLLATAEAEDWERRKGMAAAAANLFLPRQEAQGAQNDEALFLRYWPQLAWAYVTGQVEAAGSDSAGSAWLVDCLVRYREDGGAGVELAAGRIADEAVAIAGEEEPDWERLAAMVERSRELGLAVNWWRLENRLWELGMDREGLRGLAAMLGFAV